MRPISLLIPGFERRTSIFAAVAVLVLIAAAPAARASTLYGIDWSTGTLWNVNSSTGATTSIGSTSMIEPVGIAFSPGGTLYGLDEQTNKLYTINENTGATTLVTTISIFQLIEGDIAFGADGTLYGIQDDHFGELQLFTIDTTTGATTDVGAIISNITDNDLSAMAFDSSGNLWVYDQGASKLYTVSTSTGAILTSVDLSVTGTGVTAGMSFDPATGTLYLATGVGTEDLYTVNTSTGVMTLVGTTGENLSGLAFAPSSVPEPSSWAMLLIGGLCMGAGFVRRLHQRCSDSIGTER